ncbi:MAG TPA: tRNA uracil 4-sulfurtransferase ThiI [Vicinamibacterales bacterium]|nr:tRNA uracil 4-sulfurtransferase ThiI [Vicinamibacterales bacterium]
MNSIVVHYQEIALKGRNRPWFIARLVRNIKTATSDLDVTRVVTKMGRIEIMLGGPDAWEPVADRLRHVFGIANFSRAALVPLDIDGIATAILEDLRDVQVSTFRVSAKRADKRFPLTSPQIEREVGGRIKEAKGWRVNLDDPEFTIHLEALTGEAFYHFGKEMGPGGMPTGVSGRVVALLSGGIDSPVACYRIMKRGCRVIPVHFHSYPILSRASQEKVRELAAVLTRYQQFTRLYMVAFGEIQQQVMLGVSPPLRVVIYRRLMMRIAQGIAEKAHAGALVTGEVIGQVASQTLENMATIGAVATLPVFRPLIGMDKDEITAEAQRLGTYPISIIEDQDCCQLFTPKHPATKARAQDIARAESALPMDDFVRQAVESAVVEDFNYPSVKITDSRRA